MAIEFKQVSKLLGAETHIYPTDLSLQKGEFNILLGTTLSGKTSLLRLMAGLDRPSSGTVWFNGENVTGTAVQKRSVAMVYQQFINYPNFTVFDNIASPLRVAKRSKNEIKQRVSEIAELLNLTPMLQRLPSELSGGQQQRTALARALVKNAELVLLDEPLANLDYKLREQLRDELPKLFQNTGATVVYATSEPLEALLLGGYTATLHEGKVVQYGRTAHIYRNPINLVGAQVFADPPLNTAIIKKIAARFYLTDSINWHVPDSLMSLADGQYTLAVRPYHLTMNQSSSNSVQVKSSVQVAEISGSESIIHVDAVGNSWVSESQGVHAFQVGDTADLYINTERCLYFAENGDLLN